ncbi:MAG: maleylpyruvate isomerase N-terminal domain-containing protein [Actinobacteria bacterium]|nr:maleylpyruvate isomerase N-terminal domain-containing protein [Actinomycetota bacterium]
MEAVVAALDEQQAELEGLLAGLDDLAWTRPSRCPGWSVADVLLHVCHECGEGLYVGRPS